MVAWLQTLSLRNKITLNRFHWDVISSRYSIRIRERLKEFWHWVTNLLLWIYSTLLKDRIKPIITLVIISTNLNYSSILVNFHFNNWLLNRTENWYKWPRVQIHIRPKDYKCNLSINSSRAWRINTLWNPHVLKIIFKICIMYLYSQTCSVERFLSFTRK